MFNGILAWGKSKRYTDESLIGVGALKGAPAEVSDSEIDPTTGNTTITFSWEDTEGQTHTSEVEVQRGPQGEQGIQGIQGIQGNKGDAPTITEIVNTVYNYQVKFDGSNSVTTPNLKGNAWFFGTQITSTDEAGVTSIIEHSKLYDLYLNTNTDNLYQRTDFNPIARKEVENHWVKVGTLQGKEGLNAYRTWLTIPGNEGKTIMQWVEETSGQSYAIQKVWEKPNILDESTELNVWYFYKTGKQMDSTKFKQKLYSYNLEHGYTAGDKIAFKIVDGEDTIWVPVTLTQNIDAPATGHTRYFQLTFCNPTLFTVSDYTDDLYNSQLIMSNATETSGITTSGCPVGYTEITLGVQPMSNDAWKYISSPIDGALPPGMYAYWNGVKYIILNISISGSPREGYQPVLMWDEQRNIGMLWSYKTADETYELAYPFFTKTYLSDRVPEGVIDMSGTCDLIQLGTWNQTIYVSPSGARIDANEVTIATGSDFAGVVMQSSFDAVVGTGELHTEAQTVKGGVNELNDILRVNTTDELDTNVKNVFGAINELNAKIGDADFDADDVDKLMQIKSKTIGTETVYSPQAVNVLDLIYPIGAIALGVHPEIGTWSKITDAAGKALWGSDETHLAGTTIAAGLPLPKIANSGSHTHTWNGFYGLSTTGDKYCQSRNKLSDPTDTTCNSSGSHTHTFTEDSIYKSSNTTVQPPAYVVDVWIRTA